jgi:hypothetical protein
MSLLLFSTYFFGCVENSFLKFGWFDDDEEEESASSNTGSNSQPSDEPSSEPSSEPAIEPAQEPSSEPASEPASEPSNEPSDEPGDSPSNPDTPEPGDLIINEVMINPEAVNDSMGEWVEIWNRSTLWITLEGLHLADDGVDDYVIDSIDGQPLVVGPDALILICSDADYWNNGGVDCDGTFYYWTLGGGFGMSNSSDEVILRSATGVTLDQMSYLSGFSIEGASMGVDPDDATLTGNDDPDNWCDQFGFMSQGDAGSPGLSNDQCW